MKQLAFPIAITVSTIAIVIGAVLIFSPANKPVTTDTELQDAQSQDVLNSANLTRDINILRTAINMPSFVEDSGLVKEADDASAGASKANSMAVAGDGKIVDSFTMLSGNYYSTEALLKQWMQDPAKATILAGNGSKIGVWVSYIVRDKGEKPVPWIAVIIK